MAFAARIGLRLVSKFTSPLINRFSTYGSNLANNLLSVDRMTAHSNIHNVLTSGRDQLAGSLGSYITHKLGKTVGSVGSWFQNKLSSIFGIKLNVEDTDKDNEDNEDNDNENKVSSANVPEPFEDLSDAKRKKEEMMRDDPRFNNGNQLKTSEANTGSATSFPSSSSSNLPF